MNEILFIIITSSLSKYLNRVEAIMNSWGKDLQSYILVTDLALSSNYNYYCATNDSSYASAEKKLIKIINNINKYKLSHNYKWFFVCDDDTFVNTSNLLQEIKLFDSKDLVIVGKNIKGCYAPLPNLEYLSGGAGMLFSRPAIMAYSFLVEEKNYTGYSDVTISGIFRPLAVKLIDNNKFESQNIFKESNITCHYVTEENQKEYYRLCKLQ